MFMLEWSLISILSIGAEIAGETNAKDKKTKHIIKSLSFIFSLHLYINCKVSLVRIYEYINLVNAITEKGFYLWENL